MQTTHSEPWHQIEGSGQLHPSDHKTVDYCIADRIMSIIVTEGFYWAAVGLA